MSKTKRPPRKIFFLVHKIFRTLTGRLRARRVLRIATIFSLSIDPFHCAEDINVSKMT